VKVFKDGPKTTIALESERELALLRYVLDRATFTDTPPQEQDAILGFAAKAIDQLAKAEGRP
jgi:hypothetical protein